MLAFSLLTVYKTAFLILTVDSSGGIEVSPLAISVIVVTGQQITILTDPVVLNLSIGFIFNCSFCMAQNQGYSSYSCVSCDFKASGMIGDKPDWDGEYVNSKGMYTALTL